MINHKKLIIGNWKMNPSTTEEAKRIFSKVKRVASKLKKVTTVICPSDVHLPVLARLASGGNVFLGVQDVFWEDQGFFTGQISPAMAKNAGATYAIIGHSEKRKLGETSEQVALKLEAVIRDGLTAVVCVGETERDRDGRFYEELKNQILVTFSRVPRGFFARSTIIAYEPVWEIGKSDFRAMKSQDIHETSIFIRKVINDAFGSEAADLPILYGGSVSPDNAAVVTKESGVEGLLVGRQSLDPDAFSEILVRVEGSYAKK